MNDNDESRRPRRTYTLQSVVEYVWHNRLKVVRDFVAAIAIVFTLGIGFEYADLPWWSYYALLFLVLLVYVQFVNPWEKPGEDE